MTEAADKVVIHQADGLHVGVDDCRATKLKPCFFKSLLMVSDRAFRAGPPAKVRP